MQAERRASLIYLTSSTHAKSGLAAQRARTDKMITAWRRTAPDAPGNKIKRYVSATGKRLDTLTSARAAVDNRTVDLVRAVRPFNDIIDSAFLINYAASELDDFELAADVRALIGLTRAREMLAREDALLAGVLAKDRLGAGDLTQVVQAVALRRSAERDAHAQLSSADTARYTAITQASDYAALQRLEDQLISQPRSQARLGVTAAQWHTATSAVLSRLDEAIDAGGDDLVERARPGAIGVLISFAFAVVLGLVAVIASIVLAVTTARSLLTQLKQLARAAHELADHRLPSVVDRLSRGEKVDVAAEAPPLKFSGDEVGDVGRAINAVQQTAIGAAVALDKTREGAAEILQNIARRTQSSVLKQLALLDALERRKDIDVTRLKELFELDHLATRQRGFTLDLLILSGVKLTGARPHPLLDVIRDAQGHAKDYQRVQVHPVPERWLTGSASTEITRLLAALIENATSFSPGPVDVETEETATGLAVSVIDRGLGLKAEQLDAANAMIANPPSFDQAPRERIGLLLIGRVAQRHGLTVTLNKSPYGGIRAVVLLPHTVFSEPPQLPAAPRPAAAVAEPPASQGEATLATPRGGLALLVGHRPDDEPQDPDNAPDAPGEVPLTVDHAPAQQAPQASDETRSELDTEQTSGGLPVRVPQASLAPALQTDEPRVVDDAVDLRDPEEVKRIMSSYQRGTQQARQEVLGEDEGGRSAGQDGGASGSANPAQPYREPEQRS
ncbi:nitrate- and nitrite sensing domain-containing protein [Actinomadura fulvescens]